MIKKGYFQITRTPFITSYLKQWVVLLFVFAGFATQNNVMAYCTPTAGGNGLYDLSQFYLEDIQLPNYGATYGGNAYLDHTSDYTTELIPGETYTLEAHHESGCCMVGVGIWIDWDQQGSWDPSHLVYASPGDDHDDANPVVIQFTVPDDAVAGETRLRYGWARDSGPADNDYCAAWDSPTLYSGFRDFGIEIPEMGPPTASFHLPDTLCTSIDYDFRSLEPAGADHAWSVNGIPVGSDPEISHSFDSAGHYDVTLTITNDQGQDQMTRSVVVESPEDPPSPDFIASSNFIMRDEVDVDGEDEIRAPVTFYDLSNQCPNTWTWEVSPDEFQLPQGQVIPTYEFRGNNSLTSRNPEFLFIFPGQYDITLTAENDSGSSVITKEKYVHVAYQMCFEIEEFADRSTDNQGMLTDDAAALPYGDEECSFVIEPCVSDLYMVIDDLELECGSDFLRVYDGRDNTGIPLYESCQERGLNGFTGGGNQDECDASDICLPPDTLYSTTGRFYVEFEGGNNSDNLQGFALRWGGDDDKRPTRGSFEVVSEACIDQEVHFENTTIGNVEAFAWDYQGNGIIDDSVEHGSFEYPVADTYHPRLFTRDCAGNLDTFEQSITITDPASAPEVSISASNNNPWINDDVVELSADVEGCYTDIEWHISPESYILMDETDLQSTNPRIQFTQAGCYDITLTVTNPSGETVVVEDCFIHAEGYCVPIIGQTIEDLGISRVKLANLDHERDAGQHTYMNYAFMEGMLIELEAGQSYEIEVRRPSTVNPVNRTVWIDYGQDANFNDATDIVAFEENSNAAVMTATFTVPSWAEAGETRMRIGSGFGGQELPACPDQAVGEYADFPVNIAPNTADPVLTLHGSDPYAMDVFSSYTDPGYEAFDGDYDLTYRVESDASAIDTATVGSYNVHYQVSDYAGNTVTATRQVNVEDNIPPELTLLGDDTVQAEVGFDFEEPGYTVSDNYWPEDDIVVTTTTNLNMEVLGTYVIEYCAEDGSGNTTCANRVVEVVDTRPPEITFAEDTFTVEVFSDFEPDFEVTDNYSAWEDMEVELGGTFEQADELGYFTFEITATDESGNTADATAVIQVVDTTPPEIELLGPSVVNVARFSDYQDPGVRVSDNYDDSPEIITGGSFEGTDKQGTFIRTYYAVDQSGNQSETVQRTFSVSPATALSEDAERAFRIYPNPVSKELTIETSLDVGYELTVMDVSGRVVMSQMVDSGEAQLFVLDVRELDAGTYIIRVQDNHGSFTERVTVVE